jgi:hypothetical protein
LQHKYHGSNFTLLVLLGLSAAVIFGSATRESTLTAQRLGGRGRQVDQRQLSLQLLDADVSIRQRAFGTVQRIPVADMSPELRGALTSFLIRTNQDLKNNVKLDIPLVHDPQVIASLQRTVAKFKDPQAIVILADSLGLFTIIRPMVDFGEAAVPALLKVISSPESHYTAVDDALRILRVMIEEPIAHPLSASSKLEIEAAVRKRLTEKQTMFTTIWYAIDLAAVLENEGLRQIIRSLSSDTAVLEARGVTEASLIEKTKKRAIDRLAGVLALPRPASFKE